MTVAVVVLVGSRVIVECGPRAVRWLIDQVHVVSLVDDLDIICFQFVSGLHTGLGFRNWLRSCRTTRSTDVSMMMIAAADVLHLVVEIIMVYAHNAQDLKTVEVCVSKCVFRSLCFEVRPMTSIETAEGGVFLCRLLHTFFITTMRS